MADIGIVKIPSRFESLRDAVGADRVSQVLIEPVDDLPAIKQLVAEVKSSGQGKLIFLLGSTGAGKTSLAEAIRIYLADAVATLITPPADYELSLAELPRWISVNVGNLVRSSGKALIAINLDGREIPTLDENATRAAMVNLNALLRNTPNLVLLWPIVSKDFAYSAIERLTQLGGQSAISVNPIHAVRGIPKSRYYDVLNLILDTTSVKLQDAAVSQEEARSLVDEAQNIGDYLFKVQQLVVSRYDLGTLGVNLPKVLICITSNVDTAQACRMLRRGSGYFADPDRILQFSRANAADDWRNRGKQDPRKGFAFIASLFELKIVHASSSAVVNACAFSQDSDLHATVRQHYPSPVSSNAGNSMSNSSLYRALSGKEDVGPSKGGASEQIRYAYEAIQKLSKTKHGQINKSIIEVLMKQNKISMPSLQFEYKPFAGTDRELRVDVWFKRDDRPEVIEFTHRDNEHSSESNLSSYVLGKMEDYARDYGLI